jgi:hypothetical protein
VRRVSSPATNRRTSSRDQKALRTFCRDNFRERGHIFTAEKQMSRSMLAFLVTTAIAGALASTFAVALAAKLAGLP